MSRKVIDHFIATKGKRPCALALTDINSKGLLVPSEEPKAVKVQTDAHGRRRTDKARAECEQMIRRTLEAIHELRGSLPDGWAKIEPLLQPGAYAVEPVRKEKEASK